MTATLPVSTPAPAEGKGLVYCPICTHSVEATVVATSRGMKVKANQKCPRCASQLDAAVVLQFHRAA